jgi:hypothetical protein
MASCRGGQCPGPVESPALRLEALDKRPGILQPPNREQRLDDIRENPQNGWAVAGACLKFEAALQVLDGLPRIAQRELEEPQRLETADQGGRVISLLGKSQTGLPFRASSLHISRQASTIASSVRARISAMACPVRDSNS